jgi:hypothetical protein
MLIKRMEEFNPEHGADPNKSMNGLGPLKLARYATSATVAAPDRPQTVNKLFFQAAA